MANQENPIRILLVDDQTIVRAGISRLVGESSTLKIVGEAKNGQEALEKVKAHKPDVVLMDLEMPDMDGVAATRSIKATFPDIKVIILSGHTTGQKVLDAIRAGAKGYIPKDSDLTELGRAILNAMQGQTYLSPKITNQFLNFVRSIEPVPRQQQV